MVLIEICEVTKEQMASFVLRQCLERSQRLCVYYHIVLQNTTLRGSFEINTALRFDKTV